MSHVEPIDEATPILIDDVRWETLNELTQGSSGLCFQCGVCTATCPWGEVRDEYLSVRTIIRRAQLGLDEGGESVWLCTACAQCRTLCPRDVDIVGIFRSLRTLAWQDGQVPQGLPTVLWSMYWNQNPWSQPPSQRLNWAKDLNIPIFDPDQHEILLYAGCTSSYDSRAQKIARSLVNVLQATDVRFGYLGEEEPCCGESVLSLGHRPYFDEIAADTVKVFQARGVRDLMTISPHCYDVFLNHYPESGWEFTPLHYTQYLVQLIEGGRLEFPRAVTTPIGETSTKIKITFQDPCYLGRHNQEYLAPRRILAAIPGADLVEMDPAEKDGLCCGGGGGRMWLETPAGERFSDLRISQAAETGAHILVTACPFCLVCLEDSIKAVKDVKLSVLDVAEIAVLALGESHG